MDVGRVQSGGFDGQVIGVWSCDCQVIGGNWGCDGCYEAGPCLWEAGCDEPYLLETGCRDPCDLRPDAEILVTWRPAADILVNWRPAAEILLS